MANRETNYLQLIYRLAIGLITLWFISIIWPYISDVVLMLVFAFLFTTVLLSSVDALERKISHRGLSVLAVVMILIGGIGVFIGSFISQISQQATEFSNRIDKDTLTQEFKIIGEDIADSMPTFLQNIISSNDDMAGKIKRTDKHYYRFTGFNGKRGW